MRKQPRYPRRRTTYGHMLALEGEGEMGTGCHVLSKLKLLLLILLYAMLFAPTKAFGYVAAVVFGSGRLRRSIRVEKGRQHTSIPEDITI